MNNRLIAIAVAVLLVLAVLSTSAYTVDQREKAIVSQFGEVTSVIENPGLHFKMPLIQSVRYYDNRILTLDDADSDLFTTSEQKKLLVDSFVKFRIVDLKQYYISVKSEVAAQTRLSQTVKSVLNDEIGKRTVHDMVSGKRELIMEAMREKVGADAKKIGVEIVDVRLKRVELPQEVSESVYRRMEAERKSVASELRSQGYSDSEKIRAQAEKERDIIVAEAYKDAQRIKGEGDRRSSAIYAQAFSENPEFYSFYRSLEAYRSSFRNKSDVLVLEPNSDFFKYFRGGAGKTGK